MRKIKKIFTDKSDPIFQKVIADGTGGILFSDGTIMTDDHCQDCCESVYADWEALADEASIMDDDFSLVVVEEKEGQGVVLRGRNYSYFLPCYNIQNGYYNSNLDLVIFDTTKTEKQHVGWWDGHDQFEQMYKEIRRFTSVPVQDDIY